MITPEAIETAQKNILSKSYIQACHIEPRDPGSILIKVEEGKMTKDLASCIYGDKVTSDKYLTTEDFLEAINQNLQKKISI